MGQKAVYITLSLLISMVAGMLSTGLLSFIPAPIVSYSPFNLYEEESRWSVLGVQLLTDDYEIHSLSLRVNFEHSVEGISVELNGDSIDPRFFDLDGEHKRVSLQLPDTMVIKPESRFILRSECSGENKVLDVTGTTRNGVAYALVPLERYYTIIETLFSDWIAILAIAMAIIAAVLVIRL